MPSLPPFDRFHSQLWNQPLVMLPDTCRYVNKIKFIGGQIEKSEKKFQYNDAVKHGIRDLKYTTWILPSCENRSTFLPFQEIIFISSRIEAGFAVVQFDDPVGDFC